MARDAIADFHGNWYRPANLVVAAAGDLTHAEVVDHVADCLADVDAGARPVRSEPVDALEPFTFSHRPTEQAHVAMAWRGLHHTDPDRYALMVANQVLGGGMSSRLFQEVREERGLAYTVFSSPSSYSDTGAFTLYAGTAPARLGELLEVIDAVIDHALAEGITDDEHQVARGYLEGATLLGLEDSGSRMARLGIEPDQPRPHHGRRREPGPHASGHPRRRRPRAAARAGRTQRAVGGRAVRRGRSAPRRVRRPGGGPRRLTRPGRPRPRSGPGPGEYGGVRPEVAH